jgi:hypothetical protein
MADPSRYLFVVRQTNRTREGRRPLRPRLVALVEHGQQAGVFDSRIAAQAVNDLINGPMSALIEAVRVQPANPGYLSTDVFWPPSNPRATTLRR